MTGKLNPSSTISSEMFVIEASSSDKTTRNLGCMKGQADPILNRTFSRHSQQRALLTTLLLFYPLILFYLCLLSACELSHGIQAAERQVFHSSMV
mmetsp:Transcript_36315/g.34319  ORF Transcript_36315/g.34319 Transcript_36315/m.34319 type:complete len:95 (+) Transcript_36315:1331-1615(+)